MQTIIKKLSKFNKKNHTCRCYDDTQLCKISCPNSTSFVRYKNNKFKFVIFISHKRSRVWTRYFTKLCIIISSTCVIFLMNLDDFFAVVCTGFHEGCGFHQICFVNLLHCISSPEIKIPFPLLDPSIPCHVAT